MKLIILNGPSGCGKTATWLPRLSRALDAPICDTGDLFKAQLGYQRLIGAGRISSRPIAVRTGIAAFTEFCCSGRYAAGLAEYDRQKSAGDCTGYEIIEHIEVLRDLCPDMAARSVRRMHEALGTDLLLTTAINQDEFMDLTGLYEDNRCILVTLIPEKTVSRSGDNRSFVVPPEYVVHTEYRYNWDSIDATIDQAIADIKLLLCGGGSYV
jgi:hypothetical protein